MSGLEAIFAGNPEADKLENIKATHISVSELSREVAGDIYDATAADFQNPAKSETLSGGPEKPFTAEELAKITKVKNTLIELRSDVAQSTGIERVTAQEKLDEYRNTTDCQEIIKWHKDAREDYKNEKNKNEFEYHDDNHYKSETIDNTTGEDVRKSIEKTQILREKIKQTEFVEKRIGLSALDTETGEFIELNERVKEGMEKLGIDFGVYKGQLAVRKLSEEPFDDNDDFETFDKKSAMIVDYLRKIESAMLSITEDGVIILERKRMNDDNINWSKFFNQDGNVINTSSSSQTVVLIPKGQLVTMN